MDAVVGATYCFIPSFMYDKHWGGIGEPPTVTGTIIYVNRPHRYFTCRFVMNDYTYLESFKYAEAGDLIGRS